MDVAHKSIVALIQTCHQKRGFPTLKNLSTETCAYIACWGAIVNSSAYQGIIINIFPFAWMSRTFAWECFRPIRTLNYFLLLRILLGLIVVYIIVCLLSSMFDYHLLSTRFLQTRNYSRTRSDRRSVSSVLLILSLPSGIQLRDTWYSMRQLKPRGIQIVINII